MRIQIPISTECHLQSEKPFNVILQNGLCWYYQVSQVRLPAQARGYFVDIEKEEPVEATFHQIDRIETNDGIPIEVPLTTPETLQETIARMVRIGLEKQEEIGADAETFEESLDFDVDEEPDPVSEYELTEMQEEVPVEAMLNEAKEPQDEKPESGNAGSVSEGSVSEPEGRDVSSGSESSEGDVRLQQ